MLVCFCVCLRFLAFFAASTKKLNGVNRLFLQISSLPCLILSKSAGESRFQISFSLALGFYQIEISGSDSVGVQFLKFELSFKSNLVRNGKT